MAQVQTTHTQQPKLADRVAFYAQDKRAEIVAFAGSEERADKFIADMKLLCVDENLQQCSPISIFMSALNALQLRLSIVRQTGQAYVLPYNNKGKKEAQLQLGYKGWRLICKRAGYSVDCELVYDCDDFEQFMDETGRKIKFRPDMDAREPENGTWCDKHMTNSVVWVTDDAGTKAECVTGGKLRYIRSKSKAPNSPAWREWTEEMYKAKAIKYVASKLPSDNEELHRAVAIDNEAMGTEPTKIQPAFALIPEIPGGMTGDETMTYDVAGEEQEAPYGSDVECPLTGEKVNKSRECQECKSRETNCIHWGTAK